MIHSNKNPLGEETPVLALQSLSASMFIEMLRGICIPLEKYNIQVTVVEKDPAEQSKALILNIMEADLSVMQKVFSGDSSLLFGVRIFRKEDDCRLPLHLDWMEDIKAPRIGVQEWRKLSVIDKQSMIFESILEQCRCKQGALADALGLAHSTISAVLRGKEIMSSRNWRYLALHLPLSKEMRSFVSDMIILSRQTDKSKVGSSQKIRQFRRPWIRDLSELIKRRIHSEPEEWLTVKDGTARFHPISQAQIHYLAGRGILTTKLHPEELGHRGSFIQLYAASELALAQEIFKKYHPSEAKE